MGSKYDVFLSHSSLDDELAEDVRTLLDESGITVFSTPTSIPSGKWEQQIEDALSASTDAWVLLTPNALAESVWVHQELAYFYGFRHGQGEDPLGQHARYIYGEGTPRPGLYDQLQGTAVDQLGNPVEVAGAIASSLGNDLRIPDDWNDRSYDIDRVKRRNEDPARFDEQLSSMGSDVMSDIQSGGHWRVVIRPVAFQPQRVSYSSLSSVVQTSRVRHEGWDFPSMDTAGVQTGEDWVGEEF